MLRHSDLNPLTKFKHYKMPKHTIEFRENKFFPIKITKHANEERKKMFKIQIELKHK